MTTPLSTNQEHRMAMQICSVICLCLKPPQRFPCQVRLCYFFETSECSPITATQIKAWTARDTMLSRVAERVLSGWSSTADETLIPYQRRRDELSLEDGCVMWGNHVVVAGGRSAEDIAEATRGPSRNVQNERRCQGSGVVARN